MPKLLVVDDDPSVLEAFSAFMGSEAEVSCAETASEGLRLYTQQRPDLLVLDVMLPDGDGLALFKELRANDAQLPVLIISSRQDCETVIEAMSLGASDCVAKPIDFPQLADSIRHILQVAALSQGKHSGMPVDHSSGEHLVGRSPAMQTVYKEIGRLASQNVTVLIRGESGTGKELVARAIHAHSERRQQNFLAVNCAAIPEPLLESELFGHERGAFTGAETRRRGKFELASGGTLFLDEIGDMTPLSQSKVLRVLQEQSFERVGGHETVHTDVRIIAATNRNLEAMLDRGQFRSDLYYRLNGFTIRIPPLRERPEDLTELAHYYLRVFSKELGKGMTEISAAALLRLKTCTWPGNVRQLQSCIRRAVIDGWGRVLLPEHLSNDLLSLPNAAADESPSSGQSLLDAFVDAQLQSGTCALHANAIEYLDRVLISRLLQQTGGNRSETARILGIARGNLRNKIKRLRINIAPAIKIEMDRQDPGTKVAAFDQRAASRPGSPERKRRDLPESPHLVRFSKRRKHVS